jgi:hypothetical protein
LPQQGGVCLAGRQIAKHVLHLSLRVLWE